MLKPARMQKIRIFALKSVLVDLIKKLHELGIFEIRVIDYEGLQKGRPLDFFNEISEQLIRMRAIKNMLKMNDKPTHNNVNVKNALEEAKAITIDKEVKGFFDELTYLENNLKKLNDEVNTVKKISCFKGINFSKLETKQLGYLIGNIKNKEKLNNIKTILDKSIKYYTIKQENFSDETMVLIVYQRSQVDLEKLLSDTGFVKADISNLIIGPITTPDTAIQAMLDKIKNSELRLTEIKVKLEEISKKYHDIIVNLERALTIEANRAEISSRFNFTNATAIIEGWLQEKEYKNLSDSLLSFHGKVIMEKISTEHKEIPPTILDNPKYASPFQFITENYSLPSYYEVDPTIIFMITIPIIYGMIVGDVGYGIVSLFFARYLMKKFKNSYIMYNVSKLWFYGAVPSIVFGLIFDEWFGVGHFVWLELIDKWGIISLDVLGIHKALYHGLSRIHELISLIVLSIVVGLIHLALGFIIAAINEWKHDRKHAYAKLCWLGVEIGGAMAFVSIVSAPFLLFIGLFILIVSIIGLGLTEGAVGIMEIPGLLGNILSYARIAAVGVAGVILAELINKFFMPLPEQGIIGGVIFLILLAVLHFVNIGIAMFEALIQGGRLNIVEFRTKFLHGGGKRFEPFSLL